MTPPAGPPQVRVPWATAMIGVEAASMNSSSYIHCYRLYFFHFLIKPAGPHRQNSGHRSVRVKSSQVVGLRDRVAIIRALLHAISSPHPYAGYGDLSGVGGRRNLSEAACYRSWPRSDDLQRKVSYNFNNFKEKPLSLLAHYMQRDTEIEHA